MRAEMELVHRDRRGDIYRISVDDREMILLHTKRGYARGGDFHESVQHDVVIRGSVKFTLHMNDGDHSTEIEEGEAISFPAGVPHMFTSLEDSLVLEWLEGEFEKTYYPPYRKIVEERMES